MDEIILIGYGGHAKSVADTIERGLNYKIAGYVDREKVSSKYEYLGNDNHLEEIFHSGIKNAAICIGYLGKNRIRERMYVALKSMGFCLPKIIDPTAIISNSVIISEGSFIGKHSIINVDSQIGKCCIINSGAIVEHECIIHDFAHVAVGAVLCGQVVVGKGAFIGANGTVIQCRTISDYEVVPAGEVVRKRQ
jgi:sugar O-acyltransferase, sialic acid O-acetyltransferase neuD family